MWGQATEHVMAALRELGGYFVVENDGEEFVITSKDNFDNRAGLGEELQLPLAAAPKQELTEETKMRADHVLDRINREVAVYLIRQQEDDINGLSLDDEAELRGSENKKVSFEPIRGDLPPDLQE